MKIQIFFIVSSLFILNVSVFAQKDSSGIYLTAQDFQNQKLSYGINYKTEKHKIDDWLFLNGSQVKVKHKGMEIMLEKAEVYGYKNTRGETFRFVNDIAYQVLNSGESILLYKRTVQTSPLVNPTVREEEHYYFSKDAASPVIDLTIANLKRTYKNDVRFIKTIEKYFQKDEELVSYDSKRQVYTVSRLFDSAQ